MPFEIVVALRYLRSSRLQSALILAGVAIGIVVYTFMAALINGLNDRLTSQVIGNIPHVTLEPRERLPRQLESPGDALPLIAVQRSNDRRPRITGWRSLAAAVERDPAVTVVAPEVAGNGFIQRGERIAPVALTGVRNGKVDAIADFSTARVEGSLVVGPGDLVIGSKLAADLAVAAGSRLRVRSDRGRERALVVRGVFDIGSASLNERVVYVDLSTAQSLLDLTGAVSQIQVKVRDIYAAPEVARRLSGATGLQAKTWISENRRLQDALQAQASTGALVKFFSLLTIVISVASVLLLAAVRRRSEIGILRSLGIARRSITLIFLLQGFFIGLLGSSLGAFLGWVFSLLLRELTRRADGTPGLPVDPALGEYGTAIALATLASGLAAILPARAAARVDPVEVIQQ